MIHFYEKQEEQISDFRENIEKHIELAEVERWFQSSLDDGEIATIEIEHIAGVSEEEYDIRRMFTETMPIYQRQAMLLTLWGAFEGEMEKLELLSKVEDEHAIRQRPLISPLALVLHQ